MKYSEIIELPDGSKLFIHYNERESLYDIKYLMVDI